MKDAVRGCAGVETLLGGWLLVVHTGRRIAVPCFKHLWGLSILLHEGPTLITEEEIILLSTDVIPDSYSPKGGQRHLGNLATSFDDFHLFSSFS